MNFMINRSDKNQLNHQLNLRRYKNAQKLKDAKKIENIGKKNLAGLDLAATKSI